jgi:hypothetical protein
MTLHTHGSARQGAAGPGTAWRGRARRGGAGQGMAWFIDMIVVGGVA